MKYGCIERAAKRIENVRIVRLADAEGGQSRLNPGGGITQQLEILDRADRVADRYGDTVTGKYPRVVSGKIFVAGPRRSGSNCELPWRQRIDPAIGAVQDSNDNCCRDDRGDPTPPEAAPHYSKVLSWFRVGQYSIPTRHVRVRGYAALRDFDPVFVRSGS